ncbi:hypothetical protein GWI33_005285 [Rhynchophorus ferrugineus]|uniref:Uncharacterized protein n=1 Tax=Rhynchophorus ferrugineus TaxID=354439 RepID=A0A834IGX5_RHYFE|nr:hypothetical protein GWI33_005285 [Rhynchophorus ferrugineus]
MNDLGKLFSIPQPLIFPNEINDFFRNKVTVLLHENALLQDHLSKKEKQCSLLEKRLSETSQKLKDDDGSSIIARLNKSSNSINEKIVDLSKSLREKCAELEKYKTKCSKLTSYIEQNKQNESIEQEIVKQEHSPSEKEHKSELKALQAKLTSITNKLLEMKNVNLQLKNELLYANKILLQETGETLNSLKENTNWKGRVQIISDLQEKNKKLKEKLSERKLLVKDSNAVDKISGKISLLENANREISSVNASLNTKIDTLKSKCTRLEVERQDLKTRVLKLNEENEKNCDCIDKLNKKLAEVDAEKKKFKKSIDENLQKANTEIERLLRQNEKLGELLRSSTENPNNNEQFASEKQSIYNKLEQEKKELLKLVEMYKIRLEQARTEHEKLQQCLVTEKQKRIRLEIAMAKNDVESMNSSGRSGYSTVNTQKNSEHLKDQLQLAEENVKILKNKLLREQYERQEDYREFSKILMSSTSNVQSQIDKL